MPYAIHKYSKCIGETDRQDQNVNKYRISICTKKWWWALYSWGIDFAIQNSWLLYRHTHPEWKLLDVRQYIERSFLEEYGSPSYQLNEDDVPNRRETHELRLSKQPHFVDNHPNLVSRRCKECDNKT